MNFFHNLKMASEHNDSILCIGLDTDVERLPKEFILERHPHFAFNRMVIDATRDLVCGYKINLAFYESFGVNGIESLKKTLDYIPMDIPVIADAKRGDIGSTALHYAKALFDVFKFDAATVNPYLGGDALEPFLAYKTHGIFILCLTSNKGAGDFQMPHKLYLHVAKKAVEWNHNGNCGLVVGATHPEHLREIRSLCPQMTFLIPGVGTQGGDLEAVLRNGLTESNEGLIINVSRGVIYPSLKRDTVSESVREAALALRTEINRLKSRPA
jgi:orotidine 5'-phosphate decarboxylase subfamily 2